MTCQKFYNMRIEATHINNRCVGRVYINQSVRAGGFVKWHARADDFVRCCAGFLLTDVLLALSLAALFVMILSNSLASTSNLLERARTRADLLEKFSASSTDPFDTRTLGIGTLGIEANQKLPLEIPISDQPLCSSDFVTNYTISTNASADVSANVHSSTSAISVSIENIALPISLTNPLTHLQIRNGIAYISANSAIPSDPDLFIIDLRQALMVSGQSIVNQSIIEPMVTSTVTVATTSIISSLNTGPGIASFSIVGKRIFAAAASTVGQLHVLDMTNRDAPSLIKKYKLPEPATTSSSTPTTTPPIVFPYASAISFGADLFDDYLANSGDSSGNVGRIYLGTEKWDGDELAVLDVSDPREPVMLGGLEIGSKVNDITTENDGMNGYPFKVDDTATTGVSGMIRSRNIYIGLMYLTRFIQLYGNLFLPRAGRGKRGKCLIFPMII
jgi:hypothetical protein